MVVKAIQSNRISIIAKEAVAERWSSACLVMIWLPE